MKAPIIHSIPWSFCSLLPFQTRRNLHTTSPITNARSDFPFLHTVASRFVFFTDSVYWKADTGKWWALRDGNPTVVDVAGVESASGVVRKFYDGINNHDLASVEELIALDCVYDDLVFPRPFVGRKEILDFFKKFSDNISTDLRFAIDDISEEDTSAVGVTWHLEWKGRLFPFSKGCSFYRIKVIDGRRQIVYGRDSVEPAIKPGETALVAIRGVTWLLHKFPALANKL